MKRYHQATKAAYTSDYQSVKCQMWQLEPDENCYPRRWWACTTLAYHNPWMAHYHQGTTKQNTIILDLQERADSRRWYYLEGHPDSGTTQETPSYITTHTGYLGLGKCKLRGKDTVYLPGLNNQLEKLSVKMWTVFEIFSFQIQAETKYIFWTRNTSASLVQACHWHFPFWRCFIFIESVLQK